MFRCSKCLKQKDFEHLTIDHIIPKWIYKNVHILTPSFPKELGKKNKTAMCKDCNSKKGGGIDVEHNISLHFWLDLREQINKEIKKYYG